MTETVTRQHLATVTINTRNYSLDDPVPKGRDLLELAGCYPVDEHLLFYRQPDGTYDDINLAQEIDLAAIQHAIFRAVRADRLFFLMVDGRRFPWSDDSVTGAELRDLVEIPATKELFFDPKGGKDGKVGDDDRISLAGKDVEHFYTEDRPPQPEFVTVEINGEKVRIAAGDYTTETLKARLGVAADLDLDIVDDKGSFRTLVASEAIKVVAHLKFVSHVRQGGSS